MITIYFINTVSLKNSDSFLKALKQVSTERRRKAERLLSHEGRIQCVGAGLIEKSINQTKIIYNDYGEPHIKDGFISISHSGDYAVVAVSEFKVGIDIQNKCHIKHNISKKFHDDEYSKDLNKILTTWCKKESSFKMLGKTNFVGYLKERLSDKLFYKKVSIEKNYLCYVCSENAQVIEVRQIDTGVDK